MFLSTDNGNGKPTICTVCGNEFRLSQYNSSSKLYPIMAEEDICYECAYWEEMIHNLPQFAQVVNQTLYDFLPWKEPQFGQILGETMYILEKTGRPLASNDVWNKGKIPLRFQEQLPDTAYMVSKKTYAKLTRGSVGCCARGCYDRYHCYRYDYRKEFADGPFNQIPKDWVVGGEKCSAFINLREIKNFDYVNINDILIQNTSKK